MTIDHAKDSFNTINTNKFSVKVNVKLMVVFSVDFVLVVLSLLLLRLLTDGVVAGSN